MPRARNIKPGFFSNDILSGLEPLTRLLFIGLWIIADRAGRLADRPKRIKAEVLPYDDCNVEQMLADLEAAGFILRYDANGTRAVQVVNWDKHQNPHCKEPESTIPAPCSSRAHTQTASTPAPDQVTDSTEPAGLIPDSGFLMPDSKEKTPRRRASEPVELARPEDVTDQTWGDWLRLRKSKRAPVTLTVVEGARREATRAGMPLQKFLEIWCLRGSQSLQAEWLRAEERGSGRIAPSKETFAERDERLARARWAEVTGRRVPDNNVIDVAPTPLVLGES